MTADGLLSPAVKPGDRVRLVSPASYPQQEQVDGYLELLTSWGLRPELAPHAMDQWGYMAGTDQQRADDLNDAFRDPGVRAIITTRGGAGAYRVADSIDFDAVRADPKPLVGFSDITYLHLALEMHTGLGNVHGCLAGATATASVRQLLMSTEPLTLRAQPSAVSACCNVAGTATGRVIGGNLAAVATSVGVRMPNLDGALLFLEDQMLVGLGTLDRQLTQLLTTGVLDGVAGVVLGSFEQFGGYTDRGWTIAEVLQDRLGALGVPVLGGIYAGHFLVGADGGPDQSALPLGSMATMDSQNGTVTFQPIVT